MVFWTQVFLTTLIVVVAIVFFVAIMRYGNLKTARAKMVAVIVFLGMIALAFVMFSPLNATWTGSTKTAVDTGLLLMVGMALAIFTFIAVKKKMIDFRMVALFLSLSAILLSIGGALMSGALKIGADYDDIPVEEPKTWKVVNNRLEGHLVLDSTAYINSWVEGGLGETVVTDTGIWYLRAGQWGEPCFRFTHMWYKVYIWDNGPDEWLNIYTMRYRDADEFIKVTQNGYIERQNAYEIDEFFVGQPPAYYVYPALAFQMVGAYDGGIKVEEWVQYETFNCVFPLGVDRHTSKIAEHTAYVYTGRGEINWLNGNKPAPIGTMAKLRYDVGWANSLKDDGQGGWKVVFTALATGESWDVDVDCNDCAGYIEVEIKAGYFKTGVFPDCPDNSIEAKLYNVLMSKDHAWLDVIDIASKAPVLKDVKVNTKAPYITGESISFTVIGEPNADSGAKVCEFYMRVDKTGDMEKNTNGNFSYTPGYDGSWTFFFKVQDEFCRPSGEKEVTLQIVDPDKAKDYDDEDELPLLLIFGTLIAFAVLLVLFNVDPLKSRVPPIARYVVPGLVALAVFMVLVQFGYGLPQVKPLFTLIWRVA